MFVILERNAHVVSGHEHSQLLAIRSMAPDVDYKLLQAKEAGETENAILCSDRETKKNPVESLEQDVAAVSNYLNAQREDDVVVIVPNAGAFEVRLALELLQAVARTPLFVLRLLRPGDVDALDDAEREQLRRQIASGHVQLHTETVELTHFLNETHGMQAEDNFLLPCTLNPDVEVNRQRRGAGDPFRVGFLGVPRSEKGRRMMPAVLAAVAKTVSQTDPPVQFVMQRAPRSSLRLTPYVYEARCNWAVSRNSAVSIAWKSANLSDDDFRETFVNLDMLLLPYNRKAYAHRGSGMIIDGVLAGVPVLHSKGMAMANVLKHAGFAAETPEDFAQQIARFSKPGAEDGFQPAAAREHLFAQFDRTRILLTSLAERQGECAARRGE